MILTSVYGVIALSRYYDIAIFKQHRLFCARKDKLEQMVTRSPYRIYIDHRQNLIINPTQNKITRKKKKKLSFVYTHISSVLTLYHYGNSYDILHRQSLNSQLGNFFNSIHDFVVNVGSVYSIG